MFYQLASGRHPFSSRDRSLPQVVSAIVFEAQPKLSELCPDAPEGLEFILNRALEKDPVRRLHNAGELKQALGLCRMTMAVAPPPAAEPADPEKTRVMVGPAAAAGTEDIEKTRVLQRPSHATPPAPAEPAAADPEKTKVMQRVAPAPIPPPPAPAPVAPSPLPPRPHPVAENPVVAAAGQMFRYCTACTTPNRLDATVCRKCGMPLRSAGAHAAADPASATRKQQPQWALWVAIGVASVLAILLVVVLMTK